MYVPDIRIETDRLTLRPPRIEDFDACQTREQWLARRAKA